MYCLWYSLYYVATYIGKKMYIYQITFLFTVCPKLPIWKLNFRKPQALAGTPWKRYCYCIDFFHLQFHYYMVLPKEGLCQSGREPVINCGCYQLTDTLLYVYKFKQIVFLGSGVFIKWGYEKVPHFSVLTRPTVLSFS